MKTSFEAPQIGFFIEKLHEAINGLEKKEKEKKENILGENLLWGAWVGLLVENLLEAASRPRRKKEWNIKKSLLHVSLWLM